MTHVIDLRAFKVGQFLGGLGAGLYAGRCPHCGEVGAIIQETPKARSGYWSHEILGATPTSPPEARPCPEGLRAMPNGTTRPKMTKIPRPKKEQLAMWGK